MKYEESVLGLNKQTPKGERPVYGYLSDDSFSGHKTAASSYGGVHVTLKNDVKKRATVTDADTFTTSSIPSPMAKANIATFTRPTNDMIKSSSNDIVGVSDLLQTKPKSGGYGIGYVEAQIYGKVKTSDIESVALPRPGITEATESDLNAIASRLNELGIPHHYYD